MSASNALPLGVALHDNPSKVLCDLLSRGAVVEAFVLGRLIERAYGQAGDNDLDELKDVMCGTWKTGGMLSMRAGVFVIDKTGACLSQCTGMS